MVVQGNILSIALKFYQYYMNKKVNVAKLSVASNSFLILIKLIVSIVSGSVSIISEAIHSTMDLAAAIIAFFTVKISDNPPDKQHPYGHGKFENISGVIEALLIFIAAIWIIVEAIKKIIHLDEINSIGIGFIVMLVSATINFFVSRRLYKVANETESVALEADALHLKTDVYTSLGVSVGLLIIWLSELAGFKELHILDPVIAILVALLIIREAWQLLNHAYHPLLDSTLPSEEYKKIIQIIDKYCDEKIQYHDLRTRKAGKNRFVEFHLETHGSATVKASHDLCDKIEWEIKNHFKYITVNIHVEPYDDDKKIFFDSQ